MRWGDLFFGFLFGILTAIFAASILSYQAQHCGQQQTTEAAHPGDKQPINAANQGEHGDTKEGGHAKPAPSFACGIVGAPAALISFMDRHEGFVVGSFTGFLVVATVMLWLSTHKLWKAGERQIAVAKRAADVAEQSLVSTQRAFVFVRGFNGIALTDNQIVCLWKIWPIWENSGTTPSRHLFNHVSWRKFVGEMPADFNFPDVQQPRTIQEQTRLFLGPKATINGETVAIPTADLLESAAGTARVYVWGWAEYDDVFSDTNAHRTEFCVELAIIGDPQIASFNHISPTLYPRHNGAEDECYRHPRPAAQRHLPVA